MTLFSFNNSRHIYYFEKKGKVSGFFSCKAVIKFFLVSSYFNSCNERKKKVGRKKGSKIQCSCFPKEYF